MYSGKLTFQPHPHTKNITQSVGGRKKILCKCILQEKIHGEINGLKKNHAYNLNNSTLPPPSPCPLRSKMVGPRSDLFY